MPASPKPAETFATLHDRSASFSMLAEYIPDCAVYLLDPDGRVATWNAGAQRMKQYVAEEIIGQNFACLYLPEDLAAGKPAEDLARALAEGRVEDESWRRRRDGSLFFAHVDITPIFDPDGALLGFGKVTRDISRDLSTEALRVSDSGWRLLIEGILDYALVMLDRLGNVQTWNSGSEQVFGFKAEEIIGQPFCRFFPDAEVELHAPDLELELAVAAGKASGEGWRQRKDNTSFWASFSTTPFYSKQGQLQGFANITRNVSERKRVETELDMAFEDLQRSNLDLEQFAYVASHDLQEPLRAVAGCVQLLHRGYAGQLDERADELIAHTVDGVVRMQLLIDDLLSYSRVGSKGTAFLSCDCNSVGASTLADLEATLAETGAVITTDKLPEVIGDPVQLGQLFQNLIGNALKFNKAEPPRIHVGASRGPAFWTFNVTDNGIGMKPEYFDRIFVIFQRLHVRTEYPGTGLGLAICKKIVERHGGRLSVESVEGQGSTFSFTLPLKGTTP
ncbi:MAG: PAS domain S-box protein [bacterium]|nr:PAS domain S-box protein [bacterium]